MKVTFKVPYFETFLTYIGKVVGVDGQYSVVQYKNANGYYLTTQVLSNKLTQIK